MAVNPALSPGELCRGYAPTAAQAVLARRGGHVRVEEMTAADPDSQAAADGSLLPGPHAKLAGPTFEEWLATQPDSGNVPGSSGSRT